MEIKSGYKTTEFWMSLIGLVIGVMIAFGLMTPAEGEEVENAAGELVAAIIGLVAVAGPIVSYNYSRAKVKTAAAAIEPA